MTHHQQPAAEIPTGTHYTQDHAGRCPWTERTLDDLQAVLASDTPPAFRTVLGALKFDEQGKPTHLSGPMYADFDGDIGETIEDFKRFLGKLQAVDVSLDQVRLFATGGRGFHLEIPQACLMTSPEAVADLHKIYREMALSLVVDTLDVRVYSVKRQWRVPNVRRDNGAFKVPITPTEALAMTPEIYAELCSAPRPFTPLAEPTLAHGLALLFAEARRKVTTAATRKRSTSHLGDALKARFHPRGAALPPSLLGLAAGLIPAREGIGFNQIALQLCVTAHAMGLDEDQTITLARGLIQGHHGDGERYNSARKRERELRDMFDFAENSGYVPSIGGIRSILPAGLPCADLRGF